MIRSTDELFRIARRALKAARAKEVEVWATSSRDAHLRFAVNTATTAGVVDRVTLRVTAGENGRAGTATTEDVTPDGIARVARMAADLAGLVPPSPERLPPVGPQKYPRTFAFDPAASKIGPGDRAARVEAALGIAKEKGLVAAGFTYDREDLTVFVNSAGASGATRATLSDFSTTMRTADGKQSGWAGGSAVRASTLDARALAARAAEKAAAWKDPIELPPGRYTAVLEPAAVAPLLGFLGWNLDRRTAEEGRSPFSKADGGTRIGEDLFHPSLSFGSDPGDKLVPGSPFADGGLGARKATLVENGRLVDLVASRYWAREKRIAPTAAAGNWSLRAENPAPGLDALIEGTEKGILVTRIWYVRMLSPQTIAVTGLTRDATFLIENGKVTSPVKNFRINQSVLEMLSPANVLGVGPTELVDGRGVPALKVAGLGFASVSDAV